MTTQLLASDHQSPADPKAFSGVWQRRSSEIKALADRPFTAAEVNAALTAPKKTVQHFAALISEQAKPLLVPMIEQAERLTRQRFGLGVQLFAPLYLSNTCANECTYCGFSMSNKIKRLTLSSEQIDQEISALKHRGFDQILLVTGETRRVGVDYLEAAIARVRPHFSQVNMEVQPLEADEYARLRRAGLDGVLVYQETYDREIYLAHHLKGNKRNFNYRLDTPDRLGRADMSRIGLGALLGLGHWREDSLAMATHLAYLRKRFWRAQFSIGFPRIRPAAGLRESGPMIADRELIQLVAAWRLLDPDVELSLSTRESEEFRRHALRLGFTQLSAESKTRPGGYSEEAVPEALEQFEISDDRPVEAVVSMIREAGLEPIWKNWDQAYSATRS